MFALVGEIFSQVWLVSMIKICLPR